MRRGHTVEIYLQLVNAIRQKIPTCTFTTDFITGFVSETEAAHQRTLDLMEKVKYSFVYFYPYSVREVSKLNSFTLLRSVISRSGKSLTCN